MAISSHPWPNLAGGALASPGDYEDMMGLLAQEGLLDDPGSTAGEATLSGTTVSVQPFSAFVNGHMATSDAIEQRTLDATTGAGTRFDWAVLRYDPAKDGLVPREEPFSVEIIKGVEGGGNPALTRNPAGIWDRPLGLFRVNTDGTASREYDARVFWSPHEIVGQDTRAVVEPRIGMRFRDVGAAPDQLYEYDGAAWNAQDRVDRGVDSSTTTGASTATFDHNLGTIPAGVLVTLTGENGGARQFWVDGKTSTTFTLALRNSAGNVVATGNAITVYYEAFA